MKLINVKNRKVIQISETKQISVGTVLNVIAIMATLMLFYMLLTGSNPIDDMYKLIDSSTK